MSWKDYFYFTKRERNGIIILLILLLLALILPLGIPLMVPQKKADFSRFDQIIQELELSMGTTQDNFSETASEYRSPTKTEALRLNPFPFNPNNLPEAEWKKLGLPERLIKTIKRYEAGGGKFFKAQDLRRIYGMTDEIYDALYPFIEIPASAAPLDASPPKKSTVALNIELNSTDSAQLTLIKGIGPAFASRIIKYRNRLGGFYKLSQLTEVYGMDSSRYAQVAPFMSVDKAYIQKLNINHASAEELFRHPYITPQIARSIVALRNQHGSYQSTAGILKSALIDSTLYKKLEPYLRVE